MSTSDPLTAQQVSALVEANRVLRAPDYETDHDEGVQFTDLDRGLQWGADVVPAMMGLFRVERDTRADHPDRWVGFARHWRGGTLRLTFDRFTDADADAGADADSSPPVLVVTAIASRAGDEPIDDDAFGVVALPAERPTEAEWGERERRYQRARSTDSTDGATAVNAYIAALPAWKREIATRFDELVAEEVPNVRRAVRYHQPFYGVEDEGWFAAFSAFSKHVKLTFVCDEYLDPRPPNGTAPVRQALDVSETDSLDDAQVASWVRQAAAAPGMGW